MSAREPVGIPARDGFRLGGAIHHAPHRGGVLIVNSATAVPHRFYGGFAAAMAEVGWTTVTYDYRGIGESKPESLRGFEATMTDWGLLDLSGVIDWALRRLDVEQVSLIGHSSGGQLAGLHDRPHDVARMVTVSAQSGYWRLQGGEQKAVVAFHVHVTLPLTSYLLGYVPWSRFAAGEDLPAGVGLQWARWCRDPKYLFGDASLPLERYRSFTAPVLAYSFADDKWGTARSVDVLMGEYPNVERRHVRPADVAMQRIGHMGFFHANATQLWKDVADWLVATM